MRGWRVGLLGQAAHIAVTEQVVCRGGAGGGEDGFFGMATYEVQDALDQAYGAHPALGVGRLGPVVQGRSDARAAAEQAEPVRAL